MYAVLGIGMQLVGQFEAGLAATCGPMSAPVVMPGAWFTPGTPTMVTVCTHTLSIRQMLGFCIYAVTFCVLAVGIPHLASEIVAGSIVLGLSHLFETAVIVRNFRAMTAPMTSALKTIASNTAGLAKPATATSRESSAAQSLLRAHARDTAVSAPTRVLSPGNQTPGYNVRPKGTTALPTGAPKTTALR